MGQPLAGTQELPSPAPANSGFDRSQTAALASASPAKTQAGGWVGINDSKASSSSQVPLAP